MWKYAKAKQKRLDSPTMSDSTLLLNVEDLIHMAMGPADHNVVNFKLLQTILYILARHMRMLEQRVEVRISEKEVERGITGPEDPSQSSEKRAGAKDVYSVQGVGPRSKARTSSKRRGKEGSSRDGRGRAERGGSGRSDDDDRGGGGRGGGRGGRGGRDDRDRSRDKSSGSGKGRYDESEDSKDRRGGGKDQGRYRDSSKGGRGGRGERDTGESSGTEGGRGSGKGKDIGKGRKAGRDGETESRYGDEKQSGRSGKGGKGGRSGRDADSDSRYGDEKESGRSGRGGKGGRDGDTDSRYGDGKESGRGGKGGRSGRDADSDSRYGDEKESGRSGRGGKGGRDGDADSSYKDEKESGRGRKGGRSGRDADSDSRYEDEKESGRSGRGGKGGRGGKDTDRYGDEKESGRGAKGRKGGRDGDTDSRYGDDKESGRGGRGGKGGRDGDTDSRYEDGKESGRGGRGGKGGRDEDTDSRDEDDGGRGKSKTARGGARKGGRDGDIESSEDEDYEEDDGKGSKKGRSAGGRGGKGGKGGDTDSRYGDDKDSGRGGKGSKGGREGDTDRYDEGGRGKSKTAKKVGKGGRDEDEESSEDEDYEQDDGKGGKKGRRGDKSEGGKERGGGKRGEGGRYEDYSDEDEGSRRGKGKGGREGDKRKQDTKSTIGVSEQTRDNEKVLVVEKVSKPAGKQPMRVGSVEVVSQKEFQALEAVVKALQDKASLPPPPTMPDNQKLRSAISKGSASLTDTMQAMNLSARVQAAEHAIQNMGELLTQLATSGVLPKEVAGKLKSDIESACKAMVADAQALGIGGGGKYSAGPGGVPGAGPGGAGGPDAQAAGGKGVKVSQAAIGQQGGQYAGGQAGQYGGGQAGQYGGGQGQYGGAQGGQYAGGQGGGGSGPGAQQAGGPGQQAGPGGQYQGGTRRTSITSTVTKASTKGGGGGGGLPVSVPSAIMQEVTQAELGEALDSLRSEMMRNITAMATHASMIAENAAGNVKALSEKMNSIETINSRLANLQSLVNDYADQLAGFDTGLNTQITGFQEQIVMMRNDLQSGLYQLEQVNNNAETAAVLELTERYENLVSELDSTLHAHSGLTMYQRQLSDELRNLIEAVEMMREQKADRDEVLDGLRDKADSSRLAGLLSEETFAIAREELEKRMQLCYDKFQKQDQVWMNVVHDFTLLTDSKAELMQLLGVRDEAQQQMSQMLRKVHQLEKMLGDPKAAIITRKLAKDAVCASCRVPALMEITVGLEPPRLPRARPLPDGAPAEVPSDICLKNLHLRDDADEEGKPLHMCQRWVGGSHTLIGPGDRGAVTREKAPPLLQSGIPVKRYLGLGTDGKLYKLEADMEPCFQCNAYESPKRGSEEKLSSIPEVPLPGEPFASGVQKPGGDQAPATTRPNIVDATTARRVTIVDENKIILARSVEAEEEPSKEGKEHMLSPPADAVDQEEKRRRSTLSEERKRSIVTGDAKSYPTMDQRASLIERSANIVEIQLADKVTEVGVVVKGTPSSDKRDREAIKGEVKAKTSKGVVGEEGGEVPDVDKTEEVETEIEQVKLE